MVNSQLRNLISFCFLFHSQSGSSLDEHSPEYLLEKYNKFLGVEFSPKKDLNVEQEMIVQYFWVFDNKLSRWILNWDKNGDYFPKVKNILFFIIVLNTKYLRRPTNSDVWSISDIVKEFENYIGRPEEINTEPYNHIHALIESTIDEFISKNLREYNLLLV